MKTIAIISGYFNPIHKGHIEYIYEAMKHGSQLVVIVNNDEQVTIKGSLPFMNLDERMTIIKAMKYVDYVIPSTDNDGTVCKTIEHVVAMFKELNMDKVEFVFAKGGDRTKKNTPEVEICKKLNVKIVYGCGAKVQSSSELLRKATTEQFQCQSYFKDGILINCTCGKCF